MLNSAHRGTPENNVSHGLVLVVEHPGEPTGNKAASQLPAAWHT